MLPRINIDKFNKFIETNALINSSYQDLNSLLTRIIDSARSLCDGEAASLMLINKDRQELHFEVALGPKNREVKKFVVKIGEGIAGWVAQNNKSLISDNLSDDSRHLKDIPKQIGYPSHTMLAVPMRARGECIGVIEVINKAGNRKFTQEDLEWLELFAGQAGIAYINAKSMDSVSSTIQVLQDRTAFGEGYHSMVCTSQVIQEKLAVVEKIARTDSSVLILGESGVGKELFAEQIHLRSSRSHFPFIRVNCAALPEGLLESELFGHVKGAFTSAVNNRKGRFETADGGTIFLDEIGDMPLSLQAKLLRVIQQKTFEKVGSDASITVNTRIIAATNKDIEVMVDKGEFRSDLYYRLNVLPLFIPPLRQRTEDIAELARFFLSRFNRLYNKNIEGFSQSAIQGMLTFSWPGNIRELENCIERACITSNGKIIQKEDLFLHTNETKHEDGDSSLKTALNVFKSNFIRKVLDENGWNQTETSKYLDIQRTYLSRLIKELNIVKDE